MVTFLIASGVIIVLTIASVFTSLLSLVIYIIVIKSYKAFVKKHSVLLARLNGLNTVYNFYPFIRNDQRQKYDNVIFYNEISTEDFLIYQLQFISSQVTEQIELMKINRERYKKYCDELNSIGIKGQYDKSTKGLIVKLLNRYEDKLYAKSIKTPCTDYSISVTLYLAKINGEVYRKKTDAFYSRYILYLIEKLNDKKGKFYKDGDIWDAICRVERSKLSNRLRLSIYERDGYKCKCCNEIQTPENLEIDYIVPIANGGKSAYDNLQTLCRSCNAAKGDKTQ